MESPKRTIEGWRATAISLDLVPQDLDLLDTVLCLDPDLRVVAFLAREVRRRGLQYPVATSRELADLLAGDCYDLNGFKIDRSTALTAFAAEWFPLNHEGDLLSAIRLALARCRAAAYQTWSKDAPGAGRPVRRRKVRKSRPRGKSSR